MAPWGDDDGRAGRPAPRGADQSQRYPRCARQAQARAEVQHEDAERGGRATTRLRRQHEDRRAAERGARLRRGQGREIAGALRGRLLAADRQPVNAPTRVDRQGGRARVRACIPARESVENAVGNAADRQFERQRAPAAQMTSRLETRLGLAIEARDFPAAAQGAGGVAGARSIGEARFADWSWAKIGAALGISDTAARAYYSRNN